MNVCVFVRPELDPRISAISSPELQVTANTSGSLVNPSDLSALETAIRAKEAGAVSRVAVVSIGDESILPLLHLARAMGADDILHVCVTPPAPSSDLVEAAILTGVPEVCSCALFICGDESPYDGSASLAYHLGKLLGRPVLSGVVSLAIDGSILKAARRLDRGVHESLELDMPAVIAVHETISAARYVGRGALARVAQLPVLIREVSGTDLRCGWLHLPDQTVTYARRLPPRLFVPESVLPALERLEHVLSGGTRELATNLLRGSPVEIAPALADYIKQALTQ